MVKLNKIYTKTGDKGSTRLGDGKRVDKNSLRVDAYGSVDEANAALIEQQEEQAPPGLEETNALRVHLIESIPYFRYLMMGIGLLLIMRYRPKGILPEKIKHV